MDAALAFSDREFAQAGQLSRQDLNFRDARRRGWLGFKVAYKALETRFSPFDVNFHPLFAVQHPPIQGIGLRQTVDKRAESHALYDTPNSNRTGTCHGYLSCFSWLPIPGCLISCLILNHATVTLPSDLNDFPVLHQDWHGALSAGNLAHAS